MKSLNVFLSLTVSMVAWSSYVHADAIANELSSEINTFQVQLRPANSVKKQRAGYAPQVVAANEDTPASVYRLPRQLEERKQSSTFLRITAMPQMTFSIYDGADSSSVVPQSTTQATKNSISGTLSMDLNLLNSSKLVLEVGVSFLQFGSGTGQNQLNSFSANQVNGFYDSLTSYYLGLSLNGKWLASGEEESSLYIKGGAIPLYLAGSNYSSNGNYNLTSFRYGTINAFDVALDLGIGYSLKVNNQLHLILDVTGYQGLLPVMSNYNVYNAGITTGFGVAYTL